MECTDNSLGTGDEDWVSTKEAAGTKEAAAMWANTGGLSCCSARALLELPGPCGRVSGGEMGKGYSALHLTGCSAGESGKLHKRV